MTLFISDCFSDWMINSSCLSLNRTSNKFEFWSKKLFSNGIEAHAGHGLNYETTKLVSSINEIEELNIGFFIIAESILNGLDKTILTIKESMTIGRSLEE